MLLHSHYAMPLRRSIWQLIFLLRPLCYNVQWRIMAHFLHFQPTFAALLSLTYLSLCLVILSRTSIMGLNCHKFWMLAPAYLLVQLHFLWLGSIHLLVSYIVFPHFSDINMYVFTFVQGFSTREILLGKVLMRHIIYRQMWAPLLSFLFSCTMVFLCYKWGVIIKDFD